MDIDVTALKSLVREKNLSLDLVVETIEAALLVAYQRTDGSAGCRCPASARHMRI